MLLFAACILLHDRVAFAAELFEFAAIHNLERPAPVVNHLFPPCRTPAASDTLGLSVPSMVARKS